jgi:acetyl esterase/lipase
MARGKRLQMVPLVGVSKVLGAIIARRRRIRGPLRPTWDASFETWAALMHHYSKHSTLLPIALQRRAVAGFVRRPRFMEYEKVDAAGVPSEWFLPEGCDESRVLLYLHGGGYSIGSIDVHRESVSFLCRAAGMRGLVPEYRLAPEDPFPSQLEDAVACYRWLLETGVDPHHVVMAGESAGGGLTLSTLVALRDARVPLPAAAVCISPWTDLEMPGETMVTNAPYDYASREVLRDYAKRFVGKHDLRNPLAAPIHADLRGLPPLLIVAGEAEVLLDDARAIAARAKAAGVAVTFEIEPDMIHAWTMFGRRFPQALATIERVGDFARRAVGAARAPIDPDVRRVS